MPDRLPPPTAKRTMSNLPSRSFVARVGCLDGPRLATAMCCGLVAVLAIVPAVLAHSSVNYDSSLYLRTPTLWSGRLPLVPSIYWALDDNLHAIGIFQALFGGVCWSTLIWETSHAQLRSLRIVVMGGVTWIACSTYVVNWYPAILSESLSVSLLALAIALGARWQRNGRGLRIILAICCLLALARSTSAYTLLFTGAVLLIYSATRNRRQLLKASLLIAAALSATIMSASGNLWQQPFLHSLSERILPDPAFTAWFGNHGMPITDGLQRLTGPYSVSTDYSYYHAPSLASFRHWMNHSGKHAFLLFMVTHPVSILRGTFGMHEELGPKLITYYGGGMRRPWLPLGLGNLLLSYRQVTLIVLVGIDIAVMPFVWIRRGWTRAAALWIGIAAFGVMTLVLDWAGDSWEVGRHSVEGTLCIALAGLMFLNSLTSPTRPGGAGFSRRNNPLAHRHRISVYDEEALDFGRIRTALRVSRGGLRARSRVSRLGERGSRLRVGGRCG